jgi:hypothetical protein
MTVSHPPEETTMEYRVTWAIDIDAGSPEEAARLARDAQVRADTIATVFEVSRGGAWWTVDLTEQTCGRH